MCFGKCHDATVPWTCGPESALPAVVLHVFHLDERAEEPNSWVDAVGAFTLTSQTRRIKRLCCTDVCRVVFANGSVFPWIKMLGVGYCVIISTKSPAQIGVWAAQFSRDVVGQSYFKRLLTTEDKQTCRYRSEADHHNPRRLLVLGICVTMNDHTQAWNATSRAAQCVVWFAIN